MDWGCPGRQLALGTSGVMVKCATLWSQPSNKAEMNFESDSFSGIHGNTLIAPLCQSRFGDVQFGNPDFRPLSCIRPGFWCRCASRRIVGAVEAGVCAGLNIDRARISLLASQKFAPAGDMFVGYGTCARGSRMHPIDPLRGGI